MLSQREITCPHEAVQDWTIKLGSNEMDPPLLRTASKSQVHFIRTDRGVHPVD